MHTAVRFIDGKVADVQTLFERPLSKVEEHSLPALKACSWKVGSVWSNLYIRESNSEEAIISPVKNFSCVKVNKRTDYITDCPALTKARVLLVPFFNTVAIVGIRVWTVTNSILICKARIEATPTNLHQTICQESDLVEVTMPEHCSIRSNRHKT